MIGIRVITFLFSILHHANRSHESGGPHTQPSRSSACACRPIIALICFLVFPCSSCILDFMFCSAVLLHKPLREQSLVARGSGLFTHTETHTEIHARTHADTHTQAHTYTRMYAHTHTQRHTHRDTYRDSRTHTYTHTHTKTHTHTHVHTHTHMPLTFFIHACV